MFMLAVQWGKHKRIIPRINERWIEAIDQRLNNIIGVTGFGLIT
jgi:hypothetical protein